MCTGRKEIIASDATKNAIVIDGFSCVCSKGHTLWGEVAPTISIVPSPPSSHTVSMSCKINPGRNICRIYSAPSLESRFLEKLLELLYPLHGLELRSQKWIISTYICLLQCGEGFNLISENRRILWLPQGT